MFEVDRPNRRRFLRRLAVAGGVSAVVARWPALGRAEPPNRPKLRIGARTVDLGHGKAAGLDGVELGVRIEGEDITLADRTVRQGFREQMKATGLPISSLSLDYCNSYPLASDPHAPKWLEQAIEAARDLEARTILVAFFGKGDLLQEGRVKEADVDRVVERLQAAAPRAQQAGVTLALENYLSARQNLAVLDRIGHDSVRIYYDVRNTSDQGYDVPAEIRLLKDRIAQFHFKDGSSYLGEGPIAFEPIAAAIRDIGYQGWIVLETSNPSGDATADARRNAAFIRKLFGLS